MKIEDGMRIGGMEILVVPEWLVRRLSSESVAILLPAEEAQRLRKIIHEALVPDPTRGTQGGT